MNNTQQSVLLVEDDRDLAAAIVDYFALEHVYCDHASDGALAINLIERHNFDVIILDLNLPRVNGLEVCEQIRNKGVDTPVLMLTARDTLEDKLTGFEKGADDYLIKPFAMEELVVRTKVLAKRKSGQAMRLTVENLHLDVKRQEAYRGDELLSLSPIGTKILELLMRESPNVVSRKRIIEAIWADDPPDSNSLKVHMFYIRKQVDANYALKLVHTVGGKGFVIKKMGS
ncbi:response regulator transcription factor [Pseudoalteromonas byunsanensis]|uniref:Two-component system response regulator n=1 Tax=Pseudoalteromonas byunsanensis TaxID=327939 RepID=A0A1S1N975_9GAMM|nr:response regulator transcription factor [Pseudoalteromonas byunsanensis]OHU96579.1 two-component system response regulator [Pseudoalteromonas byunsanensis]